MFLSNAFETVIKLQGHSCTIHNVGKVNTANVNMAKANRDRKLVFIEDTTTSGHEMVVTKKELDRESYPTPERGDVIVSSILGRISVTEVIEQIVLGKVIGYRLRCD